MRRKIEQYYPYLIPILFTLLYGYYSHKVPDNLIIQKFSELLNISLTLSGVSLGFICTMISAILSITTTKVMSLIYSQDADKYLLRYIREAAVINLLVLMFSVALLITSSSPYTPPTYLLYLWLYTFVSSFLCSYRIIHLLFSLLEAVSIEHRSVQQRKIYSPEPQNLKPPNEK